MKLPKELHDLAKCLPGSLYVVGGAPRDFLMGFDSADIDLAAALNGDEIRAALAGTPYTVHATNEKLGTLRIAAGHNYFDYTAFRTDSYDGRGGHEPTGVRFTKDLSADAFRRDFTANAIYYDIGAGQFVDPTGGIADIKAGILRTVRDPVLVFQEDALRMLRAVRFTASTGLKLDENTAAAIIKHRDLMLAVSAERIQEEFVKMLVADTKCGIADAHYTAIKLLLDLGLMNYIIPELYEGAGAEQRADFHRYDVLTHILETFRVAPIEVRLAALFHDVAKPYQKRTTGKTAGHDLSGAEIVKRRLNALKFPTAVIKQTAALVEFHMYDLNCETSVVKVRRFIQRNYAIIDLLVALKRADAIGSGMLVNKADCAGRLERIRAEMLALGIPITLTDLLVKGADVQHLPPAKRGAALKALLFEAVHEKTLLTREGQLEFINRFGKQ